MKNGLTTIRMAYRRFAVYLLEDRGASMVEYALLLILIAIVAFTAISFAGQEVSDTYSEINSGIEWARSQ